MTQAVSPSQIQGFLAKVHPFDQLNPRTLEQLTSGCKLLRYAIGQPILIREKVPAQVSILYQGQVRILGYDQRRQTTVSLKRAEPGEVMGWTSLLRQSGCETALASTEVICITLDAQDFLRLIDQEPQFREAIGQQISISEVFELLSAELARQADGTADLKELTFKAIANTTAVNLPSGNLQVRDLINTLNPSRLWLVSSGTVGDFTSGSNIPLDTLAEQPNQRLPIKGRWGARLLGVERFQQTQETQEILAPSSPPPHSPISPSPLSPKALPSTPIRERLEKEDSGLDISRAPEKIPELEQGNDDRISYPFVRGKGEIEAPMACFKMLSQFMRVSFRRDVIRKVLENQLRSVGQISLTVCGAIAEMMGLQAQMVQLPAASINRIKGPAMIPWGQSFAILYRINEREVVMAVPEKGITRRRVADFAEEWGVVQGQVLLLQSPPDRQREKFGLSWFVPALIKYRGILLQVFIASFFVQLFGLANPLITQVIIDKVLVQRSIETLDILGLFLLGVAIFEAILTLLRTYLFVDTTNRIDLGLGSEVIAHLLRLPLEYFDRRRVGELAGRINELENIRQFLTGTALTVVLDAVFSVVYIAVMFVYSWQLSLVALATVPLFALVTIVASPIVRRQLRHKAERYADVQSYLVEVLSGIQTVKAQNIELKSRWQWQERYAKYIKSGFRSVLTFSTAGSISGFLNKLSGLLILWFGAQMVLTTASTDNPFTLGQLIAFRIIAGYTTSPLLRLIQLWQSFQETGLSIERLSDVLDANPEADEANRSNISMPPIHGHVKYEDVSFRFASANTWQLMNVNLDFPQGQFVGIVGQSGSGKSTLMKLLQRLYEPGSGRILVDQLDVSKVELYSLRRQIGVVLQDTLLFNGSVQENIALANPDATEQEIIEAAKVAVAHEFIMSLPQGYNTVVGERGANLSGGQRQRIAIARTVLQRPRLLILDEATSALDYDSERQVCQNLAQTFKGETVFFITHRLTTVRNADVIIMMDQGSVVEQGTHAELMALKGRYYCLFEQQDSQL
ncbi:peptidase domain-containing ABC transporter [Roseofilum reptotaenium CS-1145]|uniref:Peptidase C39 n=1 Tax=Roseofilum reptotaenium AO1-A TaxID=1925591 RepID=A0A1L9QRM8_9CYAN|nr:peptidase domain-containing ABC transporter [Roseofilum reptotaenium]MDB9515419.1 peptidase domain-containing ABC transporter [Roseofilum reptotaenium CS-1145]OJJ25299.1 peptidase C39 [Roseofilum reptotaenium AO1-A]